MRLEGVAHGRPGGMHAVVEQCLLNGDEQMECQHTKKDMALDGVLELMKNRPLSERRFHVAKSVLGTTEQGVDAPRLVGGEIAAIGFEKIGPVELLGGLIFRLYSLMRQAPAL